MHKLVVLYPEPEDREAFVRYYETHHLPLVKELPNLVDWRYSVNVSNSGDKSPYFAIFEADFETLEAMGEALSSHAGVAIQEDVPNYASGGALVLNYPVTGAQADLIGTPAGKKFAMEKDR